MCSYTNDEAKNSKIVRKLPEIISSNGKNCFNKNKWIDINATVERNIESTAKFRNCERVSPNCLRRFAYH